MIDISKQHYKAYDDLYEAKDKLTSATILNKSKRTEEYIEALKRCRYLDGAAAVLRYNEALSTWRELTEGKREWEPLPDYGDLFTMEEFVRLCGDLFSDYDGHGCYASESGRTRCTIKPSDALNRLHCETYTHVVWFNK